MLVKKVLVVDDEENIRLSLKGVLEDEGFEVEVAHDGPSGIERLKSFHPDVVLLDIWMEGEDGLSVLRKIKLLQSDTFVIMMSGHGTVETAVKAIKLGAFDFLEKPLHFDKVLLLLGHVSELLSLKTENLILRQELEKEDMLLGESTPMQKLKQLVGVTAPSNGWVLIQGENGVGKELVARSLHSQSERADCRFVAVNCAAVPEELVESELFGHEKGSFTGAHDRKIGKFEQASKGTLFLDEVGDMSPKMQAKILRALEEGVIQRVGGDQLISVDLRVIAATNKDLKKSIEDGEFREDLFFRLNVIPIMVPALRERIEDIPALVEYFLKKFSGGKALSVSESNYRLLKGYSWPGNVRELKNWVERACILSTSDNLEATALEPFVEATDEMEEEDADLKSLKNARAAFERQFILRMLQENGGNISKTAQVIGVERSHLHKKIKSYEIEVSGN